MKARYDDLDEYIADLKAEIAQNEQCATHYYNLGLALLTKRDFVAAEESFLNAVRNSPHLAEAYVQLGGICLERGDLDGCLRYNEEAANCRAKFPVPWSNIAFVHLQRGEPARPSPPLKRPSSGIPTLFGPKRLGYCLLHGRANSRPPKSSAAKLLKPTPGFCPGWNNLALALFDLGDAVGAAEAARKAVELGFDVPQGFKEELRTAGQEV